MSHTPGSASATLKRKAAVFLTIFVGVGIIMHIAIPGFDFVAITGSMIDLFVTYPEVAVVVFGFIALLFVAAKVDDFFA